MEFPMKFINVVELLKFAVDAKLIQQNPENKNQILIYFTKSKDYPEGFYWENVLDAAQDLLTKPDDQKMIYEKIKETGMEMTFSEFNF